MTPSSSPPALSPRSRAAAAARARRAAPAGDALTGSKPTEAESNGDEGSSLTRRAKPLTKIRRKIGTNIRCTLFGVNDPASSVGLIGVLGLIFLGAMPASAASNDTLAVIEKTKGAHPNEAKMLRRISKKSKSKGDKESKSRSTKSSKAKPSTCPAPGQGNCFQGPIACSGIQNCLRCKNGTFEGTACGGAYNCENNSGRIVSACTTYGSCNFNFGCINGTESSSTCTGSSSCNTNMGTIEEGTCNGPFSCNNVPVGHVINAGTCNGYAECNFPPPQRLNPPGQCFQEQSSCIGFSVCEDCAPSGRITGSSCGGAFDCEKNSGTIAFACTTYSSCNYNSGSILGTESMRACSGASSCNYNKGVIEEGACGGLNSCNNNPAGSRIAAGTCNEENSCNADPSPTQSAQESSTQVERLDLETPKCVRDVTACSGFQNCQGCEVAVEVDLVEGFIPAASTIGTYSCTTNTCCGNNRGIIGSAACNGWYSCNNNGGTIRSYSCSTEMSCRDNRGIISEGACNGPSSCNNVPEGTVIPPYSCNGFNQCNFAPSPPSPPSPQPPSTPTPTPAPTNCMISETSCNKENGGPPACENCISGKIINRSCNERGACQANNGTIGTGGGGFVPGACAPPYAPPGSAPNCQRNSGIIYAGSCNGKGVSDNPSCNDNHGVIEGGCCNGGNSCNNASLGVTIHSGSCNAPNTCKNLSERVTIGSGACNAPNTCNNIPPGTNIGRWTCNGPNQCNN